MLNLLLAASLFSSLAFAQDKKDAGPIPALAGDDAEEVIGEENLDDDMPTVEEIAAYLESQGAPAEEAAGAATMILADMEFEASLTYSTGDISFADGRVNLSVPEDFGYLAPADTDRVLLAWGNPSGGGFYGMLVPMEAGLFGEGGWAILVSYEDEGYVSDEDAAEINYDELLVEMQEGTEEANVDRVNAGFDAIHLDGWAEPPHYNAQTHKMYWAQTLSSDDGGRSLNYDVRVLGRGGVLSMSAIADIADLPIVKRDMERVLTFAEFNDGHRYAEFDPSVDKVAAYGIGALVAGTVAAKAGFFKGMIAMLIAGKKFLVIGLIAAAAGIKSLFGRGGDE